MLASTKHASPVLKKMLEYGALKEGHTLHSEGNVEVPLPHADVDAFIIVLDMINRRNRGVPRQIDPEMMTRISIIAEKYDISDAIDVFSDIWMDNLRLSVLRCYSDTVPQWLWIFCTFKKRDVFTAIPQIIQMESDDKIHGIAHGLPIPDSIISELLGSGD